MITTKVIGRTAYLTGIFYHYVKIYRDNEFLESFEVHCCEDEEEAVCYAINNSKKLRQKEKEEYLESMF